MLINSGVIVEDENGNRRAVTPEEAENLVERLPKKSTNLKIKKIQKFIFHFIYY